MTIVDNNLIDIFDDFEIVTSGESEGVVSTTTEPNEGVGVTQENAAAQQVANTSDLPQDAPQSSEVDETEFALLAKRYVDAGILDSEDVTPTMDFEELANKFQQKLESRSKDLIRQEIYDELAKDGVSVDDIERIRLEKAGITNNDLQELEIYGAYSQVDFSKIDESIREQELLYLTIIKYMDKGIDEARAEKLAKSDIDEDADRTIKENAQYFYSKYQQKEASIKFKEAEAKRKKEEDNRAYRERLTTKITSGKVGSIENLTKAEQDKILKAFFEPTKVVKLADGTSVKVTELMAKKIEAKKNPDSRLEQDINLILGRTPAKIVETAKEKGADELANKFLTKARQVANSAVQVIDKDSRFIELDLNINN